MCSSNYWRFGGRREDEDIDSNDDDLEGDPNSKIITKCISSPSRVLQDCWLSADDEEVMLEHYIAEKPDSSTHSSRSAN